MDKQVESVLHAFEARSVREEETFRRLGPDEMHARLDEFLLCVGPATGRLLNLLIRESGAQNILELGTAFGYSTVWLAEAAQATGGRVVSLERSVEKSAAAGRALAEAGLAGQVELHQCYAMEWLAQDETAWDFVLLDLWKDLYIPCFDALAPRLARGGLLVADNMLEPAQTRLEALRFQKHVRAAAGVDAVLLDVGSGLLLCRRA